MKGGYATIDCKGIDLNNLGTVEGIYEKSKAAIDTGKPLVLNGIVNNAQKFTDIVAYGGVESSTSVFLSFFPITLHISNEDAVSM
jgi:hypothetical protein